MRFKQLSRKPKPPTKKRQTRKPVKMPEMPDLTRFNLRPDIDERYNALVKNWDQMLASKPQPAKKRKSKIKKIEFSKDLTIKEVEKRLNNYRNNPKDPKILKNIIDFMKKFDGKEDDYEIKRGDVTVAKDVRDYAIRYNKKVPNSNRHIVISLSSKDKDTTIEKLYQIDTGLIVWDKKGELEFIGNMDPSNFNKSNLLIYEIVLCKTEEGDIVCSK